SDDLRIEFAFVRQLDCDLVGPLDDVIIGQNDTASVDNKTRPQMFLDGAACAAARRATEKSSPEFGEGIVFAERRGRGLLPADFGARGNVDHDRGKAFCQTGKLRQPLRTICLYGLPTIGAAYPNRHQQINGTKYRPGTQKK